MKKIIYILLLSTLILTPLFAKVKIKKDNLTGEVTASNPIGSKGMGIITNIKASIEIVSNDGEDPKISLVFLTDDHNRRYELGEGDKLIGANKFKAPLERTLVKESTGMNIAFGHDSIKEYYATVIDKETLLSIIKTIKSNKQATFRLIFGNQKQVDINFKKAQPFEEILAYLESL